MKNKFQIILNSNDALDNSTPYRCSFDLTHAYNILGNAVKYQNEPNCYVRVAYFNVKKNLSSTTISSIHIDINKALPNSIKSQTPSAGVKNITLSNTLAVLSTDSPTANFTYGGQPNQSFTPEYVLCSNIFNGMTEFHLYDNLGTDLVLTTANDWEMVLDVYFEKCECEY